MKAQQPSNGRILWLALFLAAAVGGVYFWSQPQTEVIPVPVIKPINAFTTIQWEPRSVDAREFAREPIDHPGFQLAQIHCVRCHLFPQPNQVPRETWPFVLTWMSNYLGYTNTYVPFGNNVEGSLIPPNPLVTEEEFQTIAEYYLLFSPIQPKNPPDALAPKRTLTQFQAVTPDLDIAPEELITLVHFDEANQRYYIGRGTRKVLQVLDAQGRILLSKSTQSEPVDIELIPRGFRLSLLGDFMEDKKKGQIVDVVLDANQQLQTTTVVDGYHRLTQTHFEDLNQDDVQDILLVGFGAGVAGKVSILWGSAQGEAQGEETLIDYSGALNAEIHDFNRDGMNDIMILTSQSQQELLLFLNEGKGSFRRQLISKEFSGFGYNHLTLDDFNQDGMMDLILVNGNNMEIKNAPLKPYHGIRILENNGDLTFQEKYFYPMHGALRAVTGDFDRDGDPDIAAISLYPDWSLANPETFVYLENDGDYQFSPFLLPQEHWGRWITMTTADVDRDGYKDLILGGGYVRHGVHLNYFDAYLEKSKNKPSAVVLRNTGRPRD